MLVDITVDMKRVCEMCIEKVFYELGCRNNVKKYVVDEVAPTRIEIKPPSVMSSNPFVSSSTQAKRQSPSAKRRSPSPSVSPRSSPWTSPSSSPRSASNASPQYESADGTLSLDTLHVPVGVLHHRSHEWGRAHWHDRSDKPHRVSPRCSGSELISWEPPAYRTLLTARCDGWERPEYCHVYGYTKGNTSASEDCAGSEAMSAVHSSAVTQQAPRSHSPNMLHEKPRKLPSTPNSKLRGRHH